MLTGVLLSCHGKKKKEPCSDNKDGGFLATVAATYARTVKAVVWIVRTRQQLFYIALLALKPLGI